MTRVTFIVKDEDRVKQLEAQCAAMRRELQHGLAYLDSCGAMEPHEPESQMREAFRKALSLSAGREMLEELDSLRRKLDDRNWKAFNAGHDCMTAARERDKWKEEYENVSKFATDYEQQRDDLRAKLAESEAERERLKLWEVAARGEIDAKEIELRGCYTKIREQWDCLEECKRLDRINRIVSIDAARAMSENIKLDARLTESEGEREKWREEANAQLNKHGRALGRLALAERTIAELYRATSIHEIQSIVKAFDASKEPSLSAERIAQ